MRHYSSPMADEPDGAPSARDRLARLRWRLRGAWQWPTFAVVTVAEAVLLHLLPVAGERTGVAGAFLLCGFLNLALIALAAPLLGRMVRRRRRALPAGVASDYAGTGLIVALAAGLAVAGAVHHGEVASARDAAATQLAAARTWLVHRAPPEYARNVGRERVWKTGPDLFRTCVPGPDPRKDLCLYVDTSGPVPSVTRDPNQQPNSVVAGPDNPGRQGS